VDDRVGKASSRYSESATAEASSSTRKGATSIGSGAIRSDGTSPIAWIRIPTNTEVGRNATGFSIQDETAGQAALTP
jgi:hypothetical protein